MNTLPLTSYRDWALQNLVVVKDMGEELLIQCPNPDHDDQHPSAYFNIEKGVAYCLAGETRVITWDGIKPIRELSGSSHKLLTSKGWVASPVSNFGKQHLMKIELTRDNRTKTIYATPEHRWFICKQKKQFAEVTTNNLQTNDILKSTPIPSGYTYKPNRYGVKHGLVFGDGNVAYRGTGEITLYGAKNIALYDAWFSEDLVYKFQNNVGMECWRVRNLPGHFKKYPDLDESTSYLYGWLAGYFAADGCVDTMGRVSIASATQEHLDFYKMVCTRIGIKTGPVRSYLRNGVRDYPTEMFQMTLFQTGLNEDFFLIKEHRKRWLENKPAKVNYTRERWRVTSVTSTDRYEDVYCATVDGVGDFALEDFILTGNCFSCQYSQYVGGNSELTSVQFMTRSLIDRLKRKYEEKPKQERIHDEAVLKRYSIDNGYWSSRGINSGIAEMFQLGYDPIADAATIPLRDFHGKYIGVTRRFLDPNHVGSRYKYPKGFSSSTNLFASWLSSEYDTSTISMHEGAIDSMRMWQLGYPAVAMYGSNITEHHVQLLLTMGVKRVVYFGDSDRAGEHAKQRARGYWIRSDGTYQYKPQTDLSQHFVLYHVTDYNNKKDAGDMTDAEIVNSWGSKELYRFVGNTKQKKQYINPRSRVKL